MFTVDDLVEMIRSLNGVPVVYGAQETSGQRETLDVSVVAPADVVGTDQFVIVATGSLTDLEQGAAITVNSEDWTILDHRRISDGRFTLVALSEA